MSKSAIGVVMILVTAVLVFLVFMAQGAPSAPTASLSTTLNPSQSQSLQLHFTSQVNSLSPPNSIFQFGSKFVYSVTQTSGTGGTTALATSLQVASGPVASSGSNYTIAASVNIQTTAICSASSGCFGTSFNVTVTVYAIVSTYETLWQSPTSVIVFSTASNYNTVPGVQAAPTNSYLVELVGPITLALAVDSFLGAVFLRNDWLIAIGVIALIVLAVEVLIW